MRNGLLLLGASALAVLSTACNNSAQMSPVVEEPYRPAPQYGTAAAPDQSLDDIDQKSGYGVHWSPENPYPVDSAYAAAPAPAPSYSNTNYASQSYAAPAPALTANYSGSGGGTTHTVQRGDTLFKLARTYYNDQSRWKAIFAANRDQLNNPNDLRVGMDLLIP
ncbi:MAG: LysM peptidoglycan-binding domain-containing protein [Phycisphaerales bacterium]|nr:LysM peptidoglycan-binding domain-containing protein [Phycisphaerales bacterium]